MIDRKHPELSLTEQTELLNLSRASLYYRPASPPAKEVTTKHRIDEIYIQRPFYGSRRITVALRREGLVIARKTVQKYMREMGISGICPGQARI